MTRCPPIPIPGDTHAWRAMCEYLTFEAQLLQLEQRETFAKDSPRVFLIPDTEHEVILFYTDRAFDPIQTHPLCSFHAAVQGIDTNTRLNSLHYLFYQSGEAEIRTEDQSMIIRSFLSWNEGIASLFTVVALSTFGKSADIPKYLLNIGEYKNGS